MTTAGLPTTLRRSGYRKIVIHSWRDPAGGWHATAPGSPYPASHGHPSRESAVNRVKTHVRKDTTTRVNKDMRRPGQKIDVDTQALKE